jgi:hypothetical protein
MDVEDLDKYSSDLSPIGAVRRLDKKKKVGENEKQVLTPFDIAAMRLEAWDKQRKAQKERLRGGGGATVVLEDMTAAADMELAALGFPFSLKLMRDGDNFNWVLLHTSDALSGQVAARSNPFNPKNDTPKTIGALLKDFLISNIG